MHTNTNTVAGTPPAVASTPSRLAPGSERAYRGLTVAFMVLLLASLWLFR